jgi:S1-C subfamily serine protease
LPSEAGVVIVTAPLGSAAAKAGLRARDVIVKLDGKEDSERDEFLRRYETAAAGSTLSVVTVRDQNEQTLSIQRRAEKKN